MYIYIVHICHVLITRHSTVLASSSLENPLIQVTVHTRIATHVPGLLVFPKFYSGFTYASLITAIVFQHSAKWPLHDSTESAYCCYAPPSLIQKVQVSNRIISVRGIAKRDSRFSVLWRCYWFFQFIIIPERRRCFSKRKLADNALPSILSYFTRWHFAITNLRSLPSKWLIKRGFNLFFCSPSGHPINRSSGYTARECDGKLLFKPHN